MSSPEEWWDRFHSVLVGSKITREQVASVATGANVSLRHGTQELLLLLSELGVSLSVGLFVFVVRPLFWQPH